VLTLTELVHEPKFSVKSALSRGHMTLSVRWASRKCVWIKTTSKRPI